MKKMRIVAQMAKKKAESESRARHAVSAKAMRSYAQVLRSIADAHDNLADAMDAQELPYVDAGNVKTALEGIHRLSRFLGAATSATVENVAGFGVLEIEGAAATLQKITRRMADMADKSIEAPVFPSKSAAVEGKAKAEELRNHVKGRGPVQRSVRDDEEEADKSKKRR